MKLTKTDKEIIKEFGYPKEDLAQIERATTKTTYETNGKYITLDEVLLILDRKDYLSGICRSAFHYSACRQNENGQVIYFDSSKLFK